MKLWAMPWRATQDGQVMVESSDKTWSSGEGNGKPLQILACRIPWTEEIGGIQSLESQRVRHDWNDLAAAETVYHLWQKLKSKETEAFSKPFIFIQMGYYLALVALRILDSSDKMWSTGEGNGKPVLLPWEPHEQCEEGKRYDTERWTPEVLRCPKCYWRRVEK